MRLIFLDIDGVLNSHPFLRAWNERLPPGSVALSLKDHVDQINPAAVARLNRLIDETGANVVISSTWRKILSFTDLRKVFHRVGLRTELFSTTPVLNSTRGREIARWIEFRRRKMQLESFVILDDDDVDMDRLIGRLVQTKTETGLLDEHVEAAIALLNTPIGAKKAA